MELEGDDRADILPRPTSNMEDSLAVELDPEDGSDLRDILLSGATEVQYRFRSDISAVQEKRRSYGLKVPANAGHLSDCTSGSKNYRQ